MVLLFLPPSPSSRNPFRQPLHSPPAFLCACVCCVRVRVGMVTVAVVMGWCRQSGLDTDLVLGMPFAFWSREGACET
ncbi:hypothetical protein BDZ91DRAFT_743191 [Kalaharituber pfeilii]|nr:hypothetical protein BDZ91DRAFT_743191 [Kalaharituber pfeilii]